ncbi:probable receptor-like protein kinase At1g30570 isoform X1 [Dendrobium catenatum]|uniref:Putative receptor-like protein kinase n=1 Tax=Dendrobium catenatum TaxID=906689 RepID=A0A2I0WX78_9ASPA|nr:probable receptor-like protein kinase At1g30570 isoform X1 [Dendrobium catenatum]PKU80260.1 putative receptor-like protein kinase [Dendrobium catenatum]
MKLFWILYVASIHIFLRTALAQEKGPLFINCGSDSVFAAEGRKWVGDSVSRTGLSPSFIGIIAYTSAITVDEGYRSLYKTARIFNSSSHYNFTIVPGSYCIRLHFHPFIFESFNVNDSTFDVMANDLKLVSKFSVIREISLKNLMSNSSATSLVKEYFLNVSSNEIMIDFVPNSGSFAFVNAIEVIPVPAGLFIDVVNKVGDVGFKGLGGQGIETIYRLNVGGLEIDSSKDKLLWRKWETDESYMFSLNAASTLANHSNISYVSSSDSFAAPLLVYETARIMIDNEVIEKRFNMSWRFEVDPNFDYLVRLHFCELTYNTRSERVFRIYINNQTAADNYDVFVKAGGMNKAYHEDYVVGVSHQTDTLWLQLGPDTLTGIPSSDALLNGLEIFKLSHNGNLALGPERIDGFGEGAASKKHKSKSILAAIGVGSVSLLAISVSSAALFVFIWRNKRMSSMKQDNPPGWHPLYLHDTVGSTGNSKLRKSPLINTGSTNSNRIGRRFSLGEIRTATRNFDDALVIGSGGFGKVYKGEIEERNLIAVKRAHPSSNQGLAEFETEIEMLSKLRHRHLVSMIGYCEDENEMILVYEYMANGTLRSHLYGSNLPPLSWKQRVDACIGAARGLHYLHTGAERGIIHRDVKTTNILLDENLVAKIADFGLSKTGPALDHTHVSTAVKGSFGYLDPEYYRRQQLTQKSDVYSFGVVLFEVVCARPVVNPELPKDQINLAEWAVRWQRQRSIETIVDPRLEGDFSLESLKKFGEIAEKCLCDEGKNRPTIGEVLWHLEYALQLNEAYMQCRGDNTFTKNELKFADLSFSLPCIDMVENEPLQNISGETSSNLLGR